MVMQLVSYPPKELGFVGVEKLSALIKDHVEIVVLVLLMLGYVSYSYYEKQVMKDVLAAPRMHDFFYVDYHAIDSETDGHYRYIPMKLLHIDDNGIHFKVGNIAHTKAVSPSEHAKFDKAIVMRNYYREGELFLTHNEIDELIASGAIYNARRPRNIYIGGWIVLHEHEIYVDDQL